jgi:hypothetical protein
MDPRLHGDDIAAARRLVVIPAKAGIHAYFYFKINMFNYHCAT